jgi:hypothetical protein
MFTPLTFNFPINCFVNRFIKHYGVLAQNKLRRVNENDCFVIVRTHCAFDFSDKLSQ